jgi:hypothetical protein
MKDKQPLTKLWESPSSRLPYIKSLAAPMSGVQVVREAVDIACSFCSAY